MSRRKRNYEEINEGNDDADDSVYLIPDNHPMVVLSDEDEDSNIPSNKCIKNQPKKSQIRIKEEPPDSHNIKREKIETTDRGKVSKKLKIDRIEDKPSSSKSVVKAEAKIEPVSTIKSDPTLKIKKEVKPRIKVESDQVSNVFEKYTQIKVGSGLQWETSMLAREANISISTARNIVTMLKNDCTVPFMARYRRDMTENMDADDLRRVKDCYQHIKTLEKKVLNAIKQINAVGKLTPKLEETIRAVKSLDELEFVYAPFKKGATKSKAERARALGLEQAAYDTLEGRKPVRIEDYVNTSKDGLKTKEQVIEGIQNIMADIFAKDEQMLNYLFEIEQKIQITIKSSRVKSLEDKASFKGKEKKLSNEDSEGKFQIYYDFSTSVKNIQPHQILALNRGENLKILSVKYIINNLLEDTLYRFFERKWLKGVRTYDIRMQMFKNSFHDSYMRLISPFILRRTKSGLNRRAQYSAIESFALNLKNLLRTPPIKGCCILGIDPGFRHGSKFALISISGNVLWSEIFNFGTGYVSVSDEKYMKVIREQLIQNKCEVIAIGNGTGCRNIEKIFSKYIRQGYFEPHLNVQYTIVNERGASIYSCSSVAKEEFPSLDPNLVSAVFIARTLQDPLNEFVKVEPKHLGIGMYQHDMPEKQLDNVLNEVVEECVSFVGVDLNTASIHLLKRIAGVGDTRARNIIEWRQQNGLFKNRQQLHKVKGVGLKIFEQCSGFVRIHPYTTNKLDIKQEKTSRPKIADDFYPLDRTCIHPESYELAEKFIKKCYLNIQDLGSQSFISKVKHLVDKEGMQKIAAELQDTTTNISFIAEALMQPQDYDYRNQFSKPVFRKGLEDINSISAGLEMTGVVGNVTSFGAFVDIGVGRDGLIHSTCMKGQTIQVGDRVLVKIIDVQRERNRISLLLLQKY